jgi:hypothetical protein
MKQRVASEGVGAVATCATRSAPRSAWREVIGLRRGARVRAALVLCLLLRSTLNHEAVVVRLCSAPGGAPGRCAARGARPICSLAGPHLVRLRARQLARTGCSRALILLEVHSVQTRDAMGTSADNTYDADRP